MSKIETIIYRPDIKNLHNLQTKTIISKSGNFYVLKKVYGD